MNPALAAALAPSRTEHSIFRLAGFLLLLFSPPREKTKDVILNFDREQSGVDAYTTSVAVATATSAFLWFPSASALEVSPWWGLPALPFLFAISGLLWNAVFSIDALLLRIVESTGFRRNRQRSQNLVGHLWLAIASILAARSTIAPLRWSGRIWLAIVALNLACMCVMWLVRGRIETIEAPLRGGDPFES